eukprot:CAMPEP_0184204018 /NCGR_PEP_ID=MMETSP0976-20121227/9355_1 /TAXON_ID=483370 /ORGANISM="non described non described, Strain CCMP2097" /LENGTH=30 /DNA_ID= /DNA_START= /DNA_END= /DNA_ORIENTATION=
MASPVFGARAAGKPALAPSAGETSSTIAGA